MTKTLWLILPGYKIRPAGECPDHSIATHHAREGDPAWTDGPPPSSAATAARGKAARQAPDLFTTTTN